MNMKIQIKPQTCVLWVLMLFLLPIQWLSACLIAAGFHEFSHILAVRICGRRMINLEIGTDCAGLQTEILENGEAIFCTLAGPAGGLLLTMTGHWFPRLALCALVHSIYNLLPILPLDGGRVLRLVLERWVPQHTADRFSHWIGNGILGMILLFGIVCWIQGLGLLPLVLGILLLHRIGLRKIPCKQGLLRVQ